jgi:hypothetical protein
MSVPLISPMASPRRRPSAHEQRELRCAAGVLDLGPPRRAPTQFASRFAPWPGTPDAAAVRSSMPASSKEGRRG